MTEDWKDIPNYEGLYQASSLGRIKNLSRFIARSRGGLQKIQERVISPYKNPKGYITVALSKNGKPKTKYVHRLVMAAFYGKSDLITDHINGIKDDNRIENLRYCTQRENTSFDNVNKSNKYTGVSPNPLNYKNKYRARIRINGRLKELGSYTTKEEAHATWKKASQELINLSKQNTITHAK